MKSFVFAALAALTLTACSGSTEPKNDCYLAKKTRIPVCVFE